MSGGMDGHDAMSFLITVSICFLVMRKVEKDDKLSPRQKNEGWSNFFEGRSKSLSLPKMCDEVSVLLEARHFVRLTLQALATAWPTWLSLTIMFRMNCKLDYATCLILYNRLIRLTS